MTRNPQTIDLRHRIDWYGRSKSSSRSIYPWAEMREGDAILLPVCNEKGQPKDLFSKRARRTFLTFLESDRAKDWHKEHPLRVESRRLTKDDGLGEGYICTLVRGQLPADDVSIEPWPDIRRMWQSVPMGGSLLFDTERNCLRAAGELRRMALDPATDVPPNHAAVTWFDKERDKYIAKRIELRGEYKKRFPLPAKREPVAIEWPEVSEDQWRKDLQTAQSIKEEKPEHRLFVWEDQYRVAVVDHLTGTHVWGNSVHEWYTTNKIHQKVS